MLSFWRYIMEDLGTQLIWLGVLALVVSSISWTVTQEEVFKEPRLYCVSKSKKSRRLLTRKFFYLFTCEYCFSHYISLLVVLTMQFQLLISDWRGYLIAGFALVWLSNVYMSLFRYLRLSIKLKKTSVSRMKDNSRARQE